MISRPDPRPKLQLMALHRHPHSRFSLGFPLAHSSSATPPGRQSLGPHSPGPLGLGECGPGGTRGAAAPGDRDRPRHPSRPRGRGRLHWARGRNHPGATHRPPVHRTQDLGLRPQLSTHRQPEAGRRKPWLSRPAHRSAPVGSGLRKSRGQFPAAPLLRGSRDLDFQDAGRGAGWRRGFRGAAGEAARARPGLAWRRGWAQASGAVRNHGGPSALAPEASLGW